MSSMTNSCAYAKQYGQDNFSKLKYITMRETWWGNCKYFLTMPTVGTLPNHPTATVKIKLNLNILKNVFSLSIFQYEFLQIELVQTYKLDPSDIILVKIGKDMVEPDNVLWVTASELIEIFRAQRIPTGLSRKMDYTPI